MSPQNTRCPAAHPEDPTPCEGPADAVKVIDQHHSEVRGCVHHAARLYASLVGPRVYPVAVESAALEVYYRAQRTEPFAWHTEGGAR